MSDFIDKQAVIDDLYDWSEHSMTDAEAWHLKQVIGHIKTMPSLELVKCKDCKYYDPPHVMKDGKRYEYADMPKEAFCPGFQSDFVTSSYGVNVGGMCTYDDKFGYDVEKKVFRAEDDYCSKAYKE